MKSHSNVPARQRSLSPGSKAQLNWLCFLFASVALGQQLSIERTPLAVLEGTVVNGITKEPVRKAQVTLELSQGRHDSALVATTDELGRFRFADIDSGQYKLTAEKSGFLEGSYRANGPEDDGSLLKVSSGDRIQNLTLLLFPGASIAGQVLDSDGDPVSNDEVVLWRRVRTRGQVRNSHAAQTTTNQAGEYRFDGLSPGTYYVSANAGTWGYATRQIPVDASGKVTRVHDLTTFYPAALSLSDAQEINVESGQERPGIDIRIQRGVTLSVKGRIAGTSGPPTKYSVSASVDEGLGWTSEFGTILPTGDFIFKELPPGMHHLTLLERGPNGVQAVGKTDVNLTDQDITGVVITPYKPAQVRVRVVIDGENDKPVTTGSVFLNPAQGNDAIHQLTQYQPQNGIYIIDSVPPGKYQVWFNNANDCYLKSVLSGDRTLDPNSIDVGEGAALDLQLTFSRNGATLTGDIVISQDESPKSVHVVVLSENPGEISEQKDRWPELDQSLHFSIAHMRPGKYLAFAAEEGDDELWSSPDFVKLLQSEGAEVELHENETAAAHLKLIPKDETDLVRKKLGL